jgi:hypothetical protein
VAALAAPALVADVRVFQGRDSLIRTWAVTGASGPLVLAALAEDGRTLRLERLATRDEYVDTLVAWLIAAGEPARPELRVELAQAEFAALLALVDLRSRATFTSYITHRPVEQAFAQEFVLKAFTEAVTVNDPRWLLSFAKPLLDDVATQPDAAAVGRALGGLSTRGLIERAGTDWKFTVPGEFLAESLHRRAVTIGVDTAAADAAGQLGTHAGLIVRSDEPLWFADIPGGANVTLCGISAQTARDVLDMFVTPVGPAPIAKPPAPVPPPQPVYVAPAPLYSAPPVQPTAPPPTLRYCPRCGQQNASGVPFCGGCGARLG